MQKLCVEFYTVILSHMYLKQFLKEADKCSSSQGFLKRDKSLSIYFYVLKWNNLRL